MRDGFSAKLAKFSVNLMKALQNFCLALTLCSILQFAGGAELPTAQLAARDT